MKNLPMILGIASLVLSCQSDGDSTMDISMANTLPDEGTIEMSDGFSIYYEAKGSGEPVLVIHGGPGAPSLETWPALDKLSANYRFYYPHQRGSGRSDRPIDRFTSFDFNQNIGTLITHLGVDRQLADIDEMQSALGLEKIALIGHSYGGFMATLYAIKYPERVSKLVLLSPASTIKFPIPESQNLYGIIGQAIAGTELAEPYAQYMNDFFDYASIFQKSERELAEFYGQISIYMQAAMDHFNIAVLNPEFDLTMMGGWILHGTFFSLGQRYSYVEDLKDISVPTIIFHGLEDLIPQESVMDYVDNIPNAQFELIENAGHFIHFDQAEILSEKILDFLAG